MRSLQKVVLLETGRSTSGGNTLKVVKISENDILDMEASER